MFATAAALRSAHGASRRQARERDLASIRAVVTGANAGVGWHTALRLAGRGAHVVLACRDEGRGSAALARLRTAVPGVRADLELLDLADVESVRRFAHRVVGAQAEPLDLLVNNAGVMAVPRRRLTVQGFELQFATNHLGHFALTGLLLPLLLRAPSARIVTVSSLAHWGGSIDFADLQGERRYFGWTAYMQSKLANALFAMELDRRFRAAGARVRSVGAHPGLAATRIHVTGPSTSLRGLPTLVAGTIGRPVIQSASRGALPVLHAATAPDVEGGEFFGPAGLLQTRGRPTRVSVSSLARDELVARELWRVSEQLTGVSYGLSTVSWRDALGQDHRRDDTEDRRRIR